MSAETATAHRTGTSRAPTQTPPPMGLRALLTPIRGTLSAAVALYALSSLASLVPLIGVIELARTLLSTPPGDTLDTRRAWAIVGMVIAALVVRATTQFVALMITHLADASLGAVLRQQMIDRLRLLPLGWFGEHASGRIKKAAQDDVNTLHHLVAHAITDLTAALVIPAATLVYLLTIEWRMAVIALLPLVAAVLLYRAAMGGSMDLYDRYDRSLAEINAATVEYAGGIAVVKAFGQTGTAHSRFSRTCDRFIHFFSGWMRQAATAGVLLEIIASPPVVLGLLTVAASALTGAGVPFLDVLPGLVLGLGISAPVMALGMSFQQLREAQEAAAAIGALLSTPTMPQPQTALEPRDARVFMDSVTFSYDGDVDALTDVSLTLEPGTVTALVGASGSGKSSLARLIPRFFDPQSGQVNVGGVDVRALDPDRLYHQVGFVFQDDYLLRASLADNIALGRPDAPIEVIRDAARAAHIDERIAALPRGYDSVLGDDAALSGGERQRVAIARALVADAPLLILDEATAFADPDSEVAIQRALAELVRGRTLVVIAHRLHTIRHADQIVVLAGGRAVEVGRHEELLAQDGEYARLWKATGSDDALTTTVEGPRHDL